MKLLALTKYGPEAASTRQRFLQYAPALAVAGFDLELAPLLGDDHIRGIASGRRSSPWTIVGAYANRGLDLMSRARSADVCWLHCEAFPYATQMAERWAARRARPYVFDYDDAIFHMYDRNVLLRDKLKPLIAGAAAVSAGNAYLADYARQWNANVHVVPTVVDTEVYIPAALRPSGPPVMGWIGSPSTWTYVRPFLPMLAKFCQGGRARFLAVGAGKAADADVFEGMETRAWSEHCEIADVQDMDIGIMPLPDEPWTRGKCGYKLIQYMACGLPVLASPVGANGEIVDQGANGLLATSKDEWEEALTRFLSDPALCRTLGQNGRRRAVESYSLASQAGRVVSLFQGVTSRYSLS